MTTDEKCANPEPVPGKAEYWANMLEWSRYLDEWFANTGTQNDSAQLYTYYDGELGHYRLGDYAGEKQICHDRCDNYNEAYCQYYLEPNDGKLPGYWLFPEGLYERFTRRGDACAKDSLLKLFNGAYVSSGEPSDDLYGRECAYALNVHIQAGRLKGYTLTDAQLARRTQLYEWLLDICAQWVEGRADYFRPFMGGLASKALIDYYKFVLDDSAIVIKVRNICDYAWEHCWREQTGDWGQGQSFTYTDRDLGEHPDAEPTMDLFTQPDLNMLICPAFGWLFKNLKSSDPNSASVYRERGDQIFQGGITVYDGAVHVSGAYLGTRSSANPAGKQYNQQLYWGPRYIDWAESS